MSKEFYKWMDKHLEQPRGDDFNEFDCKCAWIAAREAIIEILENPKNQSYMGRHTLGGFGIKINKEVIDQIEKL